MKNWRELILAILLLLPTLASAQNFPAKPIKLVGAVPRRRPQ